MISEGQTYKNYKVLCAELGEKVLDGNSKKAQLARWKAQFDYHTEGYKIIIDKVHKTSPTLTSGGGNNHGNMDIYLPYIYYCIYEHFPEHKSMTKLLYETFQIFDKESLKKIYNGSDREFRIWVKTAGKFAADCVIKSLKTLQNRGLISYSMDYAFLSKPERIRYVGYVAGFNDFIAATEAKVCNQINKKRHISTKISGKQLEFIINKNKKLSEAYKKRVLELICKNKALMMALQDSIDDIYYGIDFGSDAYPIDGYWKVWSVTEVEPPNSINIWEARQNFIDLIVRKTAKGRDISQEWIEAAFLS